MTIPEPKFRNAYGFKLGFEHMEHNDSPSLTVPNEAMSIKEILRKFQKGLNVKDQLMRQAVYVDGDLDDLDLSEVMRGSEMDRKDLAAELKEANDSKLEELKNASKRAEEDAKRKESGQEANEDDGPPVAQPKGEARGQGKQRAGRPAEQKPQLPDGK